MREGRKPAPSAGFPHVGAGPADLGALPGPCHWQIQGGCCYKETPTQRTDPRKSGVRSLSCVTVWVGVSGCGAGSVPSEPRAPGLKVQLLPHGQGRCPISRRHSHVPASPVRDSTLRKSSRWGDSGVVCPGPQITARLVGSRHPRGERNLMQSASPRGRAHKSRGKSPGSRGLGLGALSHAPPASPCTSAFD